ncbi:PH domain-containing protein [Acetitomaculum ruminis DSM 5522]|uniref:PH domain-containing protein n=1 Tax=Acetitomaculum ruminis DSM 5522 TaxID=1120918 RepID=A0A1I0ZF46_9FIRM|nr:PH domain-containing protein [Acetitomaculum ruminis]SFB23038.1 PH domain-containing protein [Acetitomaculum ruminis DSM 5522]
MGDTNNNELWTDKKRHLGLPISFTRYTLKEDKLIVKRGFLNIVEDEVRLYRILDLGIRKPLGQRIFGVGTIEVHSSDKSLGDFEIEKVKDASKVMELLSDKVEEERQKKRVFSRENMGEDFDGDDDE